MSSSWRDTPENRSVEGYELAHAESSEYGSGRVFGVKIFVKMSERKLGDEDGTVMYRAAREIKKALETTTAMLDPEGPAQRLVCRAQIQRVFESAAVAPIYMEELPNGYCSEPCCLNLPWFRVTSAIGHIVIGWRKRVMDINWKDTVIQKTGEELFPGEKTTRGERNIHAWGEEAAVSYVKALHEAAR